MTKTKNSVRDGTTMTNHSRRQLEIGTSNLKIQPELFKFRFEELVHALKSRCPLILLFNQSITLRSKIGLC